MSDKEQTIKDQIAAMEGWAINTRTKFFAGNYNESETLLRNLNMQGRRLEWRSGKYGLRHLPDLEEVKAIKVKISYARAAAQNAYDSIHELNKLLPNKKGKKPEEVASITKKEGNLKGDAGKNIAILIQVLKEAKAVSDIEPWLNLNYISKNKSVLEEFLKGEHYYKEYTPIWRKYTWNDWVKKTNQRIFTDRLSFKGASLRELDFSNLIFNKGIDFRGATLFDMQFTNSRLNESNFAGIYMESVNLEGAHIKDSNFWKSKMRGLFLKKAILDGSNFEKANLIEAKCYMTSLVGTEWTNASLKHVAFEKADLRNSIFSKAELEKVFFKDTILEGVKFKETSFKGEGDVYFDGATLNYAKFDKAYINDGANFTNAKGLTAEQFFNVGTIFRHCNLPEEIESELLRRKIMK